VVLTLRLLGVGAVDLANAVFSAFAGTVFGANRGIGGMPPSCEVGRELYPIEEAGRERGAIGLSGVKKLDFRLLIAGEAAV
jgi:hypothetical protein